MSRSGKREPGPADHGALLQSRFALTKAEAAVALAIADGQALDDMSVLRGVSVHTIRSQLKSIFHKTGVRSQVQLAALVHRTR